MASKSVVTDESLNVSYPWDESKESCEILITSLINIMKAKKTLPANILSKVLTKNVGLLRVLFRLLNCGFNIYNKGIWIFIIDIYKQILDENMIEIKLDNSLCCTTLAHLCEAINM